METDITQECCVISVGSCYILLLILEDQSAIAYELYDFSGGFRGEILSVGGRIWRGRERKRE